MTRVRHGRGWRQGDGDLVGGGEYVPLSGGRTYRVLLVRGVGRGSGGSGGIVMVERAKSLACDIL